MPPCAYLDAFESTGSKIIPDVLLRGFKHLCKLSGVVNNLTIDFHITPVLISKLSVKFSFLKVSADIYFIDFVLCNSYVVKRDSWCRVIKYLLKVGKVYPSLVVMEAKCLA